MDVLNHWAFLEMDPPEGPVGGPEESNEANGSDELFAVLRVEDAPYFQFPMVHDYNLIKWQISSWLHKWIHNILEEKVVRFGVCDGSRNVYLIIYNITDSNMAPKPAPKLTKKQIAELKAEENRKKEAEEKQRKEEEEARHREEQRLELIEREKRAEEERVRIVLEKEQCREEILARIKEEHSAIAKYQEEMQWEELTHQYHKSYDTSGPKLSTFINALREEPYEGPVKALRSCQEAETYVRHIGYMLLQKRSQHDLAQEKYYEDAIKEIRRIQFELLERIMIEMANSAEEMEDKNSEVSKKGEPNKKLEGTKILEYQHFMNTLTKIGMFLNSSTTKNLNKFRPIEIKEFGLNTQIPSKWMNMNTICKFEWTNYNPFLSSDFEKFLIIGGVYILEFFDLIMGSKRINNIVLKKNYRGPEILIKHSPSLIKEPFNVQYQIPSYVFLHTFDQSTLKLAQYDSSTNKWAPLPPDTIIEYDPKDKKATCRIYKPEPIAYIQDRVTDFPYVAWELRSIEEGVANLDIELKRYQLPKEGEEKPNRLMLKFEITDYSVKLLTDEDYPELRDLKEGSWTPSSILHELSERGIHLLPAEQDYEDAQLPAKDREAEQNAIRDIAYALQSFYIRSEINESSDIIVKIRENLDYERVFLEDQEKDWKKIRWLPNSRCEVTNRGIHQRHLNLEVLLQSHDFCQSECLSRMKFNKNFLFKLKVMEMLELTRLLSFTICKEEESQLRWVLKEKELVKL